MDMALITYLFYFIFFKYLNSPMKLLLTFTPLNVAIDGFPARNHVFLCLNYNPHVYVCVLTLKNRRLPPSNDVWFS